MRNILLVLVIVSAQGSGFGETVGFNQRESPTHQDVIANQSPRIETTYDSEKNKTTVRLAPVQISGEKGKYHSLHIAPSFSYSGKAFARPEFIDFELQTVVKGRLRTDLYVDFLIDGEKIFLSSTRWAVKRPIPGRVWVGERLVFRMPYTTLLKLVEAKQAAVRLDGISFELNDDHKRALKTFAETASGR